MSGQVYFQEALDLCGLADSLDYATVKIVEHYFRAYGGYSPSPLIFLAAAAQRTRDIRLVTGAAIPALHHPLKLAAELAMVDCISGGRLEAGFARAFLPHEFEAFEVDMEESRPRFEEGIAIVKRLWTEGRALIGDSHAVLDQLHHLRQQFGPIQPEMQIMFGNMDYTRARRSVELFGREVLPAVEGL